jgi:hypothetical protein
MADYATASRPHQPALLKAETYTNKVIAHRDDIQDEASQPVSITWGDLDSALNTVGQVHRKYFKLRHAGTHLGNLTPIPQGLGWDQDVRDRMEAGWLHSAR